MEPVDHTTSAATSQEILLHEYQAEIKRLREAYEEARATVQLGAHYENALTRIANHDLRVDYADVELRNIARQALKESHGFGCAIGEGCDVSDAATTAPRKDEMSKITTEEATLVRKVLATTGYTAPMHERQEARRIVDRFLPPMPPSRYPGFSDWPDA